MSLFGFLDMLDSYDERKVALFESETLVVSTACVTDGRKPIETAIQHPAYNGDQLVVVECYDTKAEAEAGHEKWVARMTHKPLPAQLTDCANCEASQLCRAVGNVMAFERDTNIPD